MQAPRLAAALGLGDVWVGQLAANPTHSFKDRVVSVALEKARDLGYRIVACATATSPTPSPPASAHGLESYVFVPADLEEQKIVATAVYGTGWSPSTGSTTMSTASAWSSPPTAPGPS